MEFVIERGRVLGHAPEPTAGVNHEGAPVLCGRCWDDGTVLDRDPPFNWVDCPDCKVSKPIEPVDAILVHLETRIREEEKKWPPLRINPTGWN